MSNNIVNKIVGEVINEIRTISFNNGNFPNYGQCIILMGAPGSGKSYLLKNKLPISGKVFDIDLFRQNYENLLKQQGKKIPSFKDLHRASAEKLQKSEELFLKNQTKNKGNIIFDICGRPGKRGEKSLAEEIVSMVKPLGYTVSIIWVVVNRSVAMRRNVERSISGKRKLIPDKPFHQRTNQVNNFVPSFLQSNLCSGVDFAYIAFSSSDSLQKMTPEEEANSIYRLQKKDDGGFLIPDELKTKIERTLGPKEDSTGFTPTTYKTNSEVRKILKQQNTMNNFLRYSEPLTEEENKDFNDLHGREMTKDDIVYENASKEVDEILNKLFELNEFLNYYKNSKCLDENEEKFGTLQRKVEKGINVLASFF